MSDENTHNKVPQYIIYIAYYTTLLLFLLVSFFPQYRVWGINWWAYYPAYVPFVLFVLGAVAPFIVNLFLKRNQLVVDKEPAKSDSTKYYIIITCLTVLFGLGFYLLRTRTHFLGDGYTLLSSLADIIPLVKSREIGEYMAHVWLKNAIGGNGETSALLSYQIISIGSGIILLLSLGWFSKKLFSRLTDSILFWLGITSSGFMLLYYGYVENYSLFVLSVLVYTLLGIQIARGKINRWLIVPALAFAIFFHILGVTLIPSAVYLLVVGTKYGEIIQRLNKKLRLLFVGILAIGFGLSFYHYYSTNLFFRFALVPFIENEFTVEGYSLFSLKHLTDYLNLLILLFPGILIFAVMIYFLPIRMIFKQRDYRFLLLLLLSTLGAIFIFDPKLGMPRDWDLFSFAGVPLVVLVYTILLENRKTYKSLSLIIILTIILNMLLLFPRITSQSTPYVIINHFKNYLSLDKGKCRTGYFYLYNYYKSNNNIEAASRVFELRNKFYPEVGLIEKGAEEYKKGNIQESIKLLRQALGLNRTFYGAYKNLGITFSALNQYDSALYYLEHARGMNPFDTTLLYNYGIVSFRMGRFKAARKSLLQAVKINPNMYLAYGQLLAIEFVTGNIDKSVEYLNKLIATPDVPYTYMRDVADTYLAKGYYKYAAEAYNSALKKGLDTSYIKDKIKQYPQFGKYFQ